MGGLKVVDFYVDLAVAVILRLLKDKRSWPKYEKALRKVQQVLNDTLPPFDLGRMDDEITKDRS